MTKPLLIDLHTKFICCLDHGTNDLHFYKFQFLKMNVIYWGLSALSLIKREGQLLNPDKSQYTSPIEVHSKDKIIDFVMSCYNPDGGFGGNIKHDSHILYTLSAIQILVMLDARDLLDIDKTTKYIKLLEQDDGSFAGDVWGEIDTRFIYCALSALSLLGQLGTVNSKRITGYILTCVNWDGGFGVGPYSESHAGQIFCCLGALSILNQMDKIDQNKLARWLAERQLPCGGFNGRPEKKADVCYSWWVLSSLAMMNKLDWINKNKLIEYILSCQDDADGGIADKPGNIADVYHTFFGLAGLSLLGYEEYNFSGINPIYALPPKVLNLYHI